MYEIEIINEYSQYNIDDILDIISKNGISALTEEQKKFLDDYDNREH